MMSSSAKRSSASGTRDEVGTSTISCFQSRSALGDCSLSSARQYNASPASFDSRDTALTSESSTSRALSPSPASAMVRTRVMVAATAGLTPFDCAVNADATNACAQTAITAGIHRRRTVAARSGDAMRRDPAFVATLKYPVSLSFARTIEVAIGSAQQCMLSRLDAMACARFARGARIRQLSDRAA